MKKIILVAFCFNLICVSCKKNDAITPAPIGDYISLSANSTWNYQLVDSVTLSTTLYTLTSTNSDSTVNGKAFHVFTNSAGGNEYYNLTNKQYFSYGKAPAPINNGNRIVYLYLIEEPVGTTWTQSHQVSIYPPQQLVATFDNKIEEKGITKTVNNIDYSNVIHVKTTISVSALTPGSFSSDIHTYFAPKVGMIQKDTKITWNVPPPPGSPPTPFQLNQHIKLMSSVIL